jgi:flavin reductase (DIM6/NTAB) family NADH-FMN oxidoreductase RutF
MQFDFETMSAERRFNFLTGAVVPRPIALITTCGRNGAVNAAPYSFFGLLSHDPPLIGVGVLPHSEGRMKDTGANIASSGEFVVNLVSEDLAQAMNLCCIDAPSDVDELQLAKLPRTPSAKVAPPRILAAPVAIECRVHSKFSPAPNVLIAIGLVVHAHVADRFVLAGSETLDTPALKLIGGMHGAKWYTRTSDHFAMERPTWAEWIRPARPP